MKIIDSFIVGELVYFTDEKLPYKVMAKSDKYAIVSRSLHRREDAKIIHNMVEMQQYATFTEAYKCNKENCIYSIVDFEKNIRSSDDLVFGVFDYSDVDDCKNVIAELHRGNIGLSLRNMVELSVNKNNNI